MIRYCLFVGLIYFISGTYSKGQELFIKGSINWQNSKSNKLYFENAFYRDTITNLPSYEESLKLPDRGTEEYQISFNQLYFEEIPSCEIPKSIQTGQIGDTIVISHTLGIERKESFLRFSFTPLRKNQQNGKLERLKYFTLKISPISKGSHLKSASATYTFPEQSVLASGDWYKFLVNKSGIYKITYSDIKNLGIQNPENVRVYGNGGRMLPEVFSGQITDDPQEIPIMMNTGSDGVFNEGDYILFYAEGPVVWNYDRTQSTFTHEKNRFSENAAYFITSQAGGKKIPISTAPSENAKIEVTSFDGLDYHEEDLVNLIRSGRSWYGEQFGIKNSYDFPFNFPNLIVTEPLTISLNVINRADKSVSMQISLNNQAIKNVSLRSVTTSDIYGDYGSENPFISNFNANTDNFTIKLNYNGENPATAWLNYIRIVARQSLSVSSNPLFFRDSRSVGTANIASFKIANATASMLVWDITDIHNVQQMEGINQNNTYIFKALSNKLREYAAFDPRNIILTPTFITENNGKVPNQNLHSLKNKQLIIVSHHDFLSQAQQLADIHVKQDNLSTEVITPEQIYNEFSSGIPDPAAIRNFMKMLYDKAQNPEELPRYLLLFGDGSYDNKTPLNQSLTPNGPKNTNFIITYESVNTLSQTDSYVTDDYFGLLDNNEDIVYGLLDIGVGRIPIQTTEQADDIINKIKKYTSSKSFGSWRNVLSFIGDDEDDNIHMWQADQLATYISSNYPTFNVQKIFMDAYPMVSTSSGSRFPDVNIAILNQINSGLLILNYTGHGGETGLAKEQILGQQDIKSWNNDKYFLFITATCDFTRFDDYKQTTAGENVLLNPNGGGIALLSTNRVVYSGPNFVLNQQFYKYAFARSNQNPAYRLGDIVRLTKNSSGIDINKLSFMLIGDPALSLALPKYKVVTDSINHKPASAIDTLNAYGTVSIKGKVTDEQGQTLSNFNGTIYSTIYDKARTVTSLSNDNNEPFKFQTQNSVLFKGKNSVKNGEFTINTILPRDINYDFGFGKISYYSNDSLIDAAGYFNKVVIGGINTATAIPDNLGPAIRLYMNDTTFINRGITDDFPTLIAKVSDINGINPGGNSLGHDIVATLDNSSKEAFVLNSYFETDIDNFTKGTVAFKFPQLSPGNHTINFKIWDIFNNSSQASLDFIVPDPASISIQKVYNYPNPLKDYTTFFFEHNMANNELLVTIEIFNLAGSKVKELKTNYVTTGYTGSIRWDAGNGNKIGSGIYLYRIIIRSNNQMTISKTQKIVVIN